MSRARAAKETQEKPPDLIRAALAFVREQQQGRRPPEKPAGYLLAVLADPGGYGLRQVNGEWLTARQAEQTERAAKEARERQERNAQKKAERERDEKIIADNERKRAAYESANPGKTWGPMRPEVIAWELRQASPDPDSIGADLVDAYRELEGGTR